MCRNYQYHHNHTTTILVLQLCAQEDVASFIASLNVFPHAAANVNKLCKP